MEAAEGARSFMTTGEAYDSFMGRYSRSLAGAFADFARVTAGQSALDVGCGPGALTGVLVERLGAASVAACDPSPPFVEACTARFPDVDLRLGRAEEIPFEDGRFDRALAQLVLHFVSEPAQAGAELRRVLRPGGIAAACVWDAGGGMEMLRNFWDAALAIDPDAPDENQRLRFGRAGEISALFAASGFADIEDTTLDVSSTYTDFDELWAGFMAGIGPAGAYLLAQPAERRDAIRDDMFERIGSPSGGFSLEATARCASGRVPDR